MSTSINTTRADIARELRSLAAEWREGKEPKVMTACYLLFYVSLWLSRCDAVEDQSNLGNVDLGLFVIVPRGLQKIIVTFAH